MGDKSLKDLFGEPLLTLSERNDVNSESMKLERGKTVVEETKQSKFAPKRSMSGTVNQKDLDKIQEGESSENQI